MTRMACPECGLEQKGYALLCHKCIMEFEPVDAEPTEPAAANAPAGITSAAGVAPPAGQPGYPVSVDGPAPGAPQACWNCGEPAPDAGNIHCAACGEPLTPPRLVLRFA